jgi:hypothetical protein
VRHRPPGALPGQPVAGGREAVPLTRRHPTCAHRAITHTTPSQYTLNTVTVHAQHSHSSLTTQSQYIHNTVTVHTQHSHTTHT